MNNKIRNVTCPQCGKTFVVSKAEFVKYISDNRRSDKRLFCSPWCKCLNKNKASIRTYSQMKQARMKYFAAQLEKEKRYARS